MSKYGLRDWTRDNYQSFVGDLSKVHLRVDEKVTALKEELGASSHKVPDSRVNLPRPQRFARGYAPPLKQARTQARVNRLGQTEVAELLELIGEWTHDRFNVHKYEALMQRASEGGPSDLEERVYEFLYRADAEGGRMLEHDPTGFWLFNLSPRQQEQAVEAFREAMQMTNFALQALTSSLAVDRDQQAIFQRYFRKPHSDGATRSEVSHRFAQIQGGLNGANAAHVVLNRGATSHGRDALAYVRPDTYAASKGALIFLGADFWQETTPTAGGPTAAVKRGATIVHEVSHYFAATEDVVVNGIQNSCYGAQNCERLTPSQAIRNADTYCLFAQELYILSARQSADLARMLAELDDLVIETF